MSSRAKTDMSPPKELNEVPLWVLEKVGERLANEAGRDPFLKRELEGDFASTMRETAKQGMSLSKTAYRISSPVAIEKALEVACEQVRLAADISRAQHRQRGFRALRLELDRVVEMNEAAPEDKGPFNPFFMCYRGLGSPVDAQEAAIYIADLPSDSLRKIMKGKLPPFLAERDGNGEYGCAEWYRDLARLFCHAKPERKSLARSMFTDPELAQNVWDDEKQPLVLRHLGKVVVSSARDIAQAGE